MRKSASFLAGGLCMLGFGRSGLVVVVCGLIPDRDEEEFGLYTQVMIRSLEEEVRGGGGFRGRFGTVLTVPSGGRDGELDNGGGSWEAGLGSM